MGVVMRTVRIELDEQAVRDLILKHLDYILGETVIAKDIRIEVKSKQNWKSTWEAADFRAVYETRTP